MVVEHIYLVIWIIFLKATYCSQILFWYRLKDPQKMQNSRNLVIFISVFYVIVGKNVCSIDMTKSNQLKLGSNFHKRLHFYLICFLILEKSDKSILKELLSRLFELFGCWNVWLVFSFSAGFIEGCMSFLNSETRIPLDNIDFFPLYFISYHCNKLKID